MKDAGKKTQRHHGKSNMSSTHLPSVMVPGVKLPLLLREAKALLKGLRAQQAAPQDLRVARVTHRCQKRLLGHA